MTWNCVFKQFYVNKFWSAIIITKSEKIFFLARLLYAMLIENESFPNWVCFKYER